MPQTPEGARKAAQTRLAKLRAAGGEKAVSEHYAKMAATQKGKHVKKGLAVLKETNPEKFKEIISMGGKSRWNKKKQNIASPVQRKARHQRRQAIERHQSKDEFFDRAPKGTRRHIKFEEEGNTGW